MSDARVIVVEDDDDLRRLFLEVLSELGTVVAFGDVYQALAHLQHDHCDLLVLDLLLPGATGVDLVERLRREAIDVPIVVVSGLVSPTMAERLDELGIRTVLAKPITADELLTAATSALSERAGTED